MNWDTGHKFIKAEILHYSTMKCINNHRGAPEQVRAGKWSKKKSILFVFESQKNAIFD